VMPPLAISWVISTVSGYGIYGLQIVLHYLRRGGTQAVLTSAPSITLTPSLTQLRILQIFELGKKFVGFLNENPKEFLRFDSPVLHACGNDFSGFPNQDRVWGRPNVACAAIEQLNFGEHSRKVAGNYDYYIAISRWNESFLKSLNVGPVHLCHQGIDTTLFHPAPRTGLWRDRFVIFSGGKFEFRKGQDIVISAYKLFREKHPDALLVVCWQNLTKPEPEAFQLAGHCDTVPEAAADFGLQITPWLIERGLPPASFIDLPFTHNMMMPPILRECDVAVFPNRSEGGTNLVAMECMACGIPTYVANNTGQKDLVEMLGCGAFNTQRPVKLASGFQCVDDWGETDVEEVVEALEEVYQKRGDALKKASIIAEKVKAWEWGLQNERLLKIVLDE